jgi:hypothetical protein
MSSESAHHSDGFARELWNLMQSMPEYRDQTTFIITTDHGRGSGLVEWKEHGIHQKGSENIWIAVIGPDNRSPGRSVEFAAGQAGTDRRDDRGIAGIRLSRRRTQSRSTAARVRHALRRGQRSFSIRLVAMTDLLYPGSGTAT